MARKPAASQQAYSKLSVQQTRDYDDDDDGDQRGGVARKAPRSSSSRATEKSASSAAQSTRNSGGDDDGGGIIDTDQDEDDEDDDERFRGSLFPTRRRTGALVAAALLVLGALFLLLVFLVVRGNQIRSSLSDGGDALASGTFLPEDVAALVDASADPCDDFHQFACGAWVAATEIPPEKPSVYAAFSAVRDANEAALRAILADGWPFVSELYDSCMNLSAINATGVAPLRADLERIARVESRRELFTLAGELSRTGPSFLTGLGVAPDAKDATKNVLYASQAGITLPDPAYYLDAAKFQDVADDFRAFVSVMFALSGSSPRDATRLDVIVVDFEIELAKVFVPKEELLDPVKTYNLVRIRDAESKYPLLFAAYVNGTGILQMHANASSPLTTIVMESPQFFEAAEKLVAETDLPTLQAYVTFQYIQYFAPTLPEPFVDAAFALFNKKLSGQKQRSPRWKVCLHQVTSYFPSLMGKYFFLKQFDAKSEVSAIELVQQIEKAMARELAELPWLDAATRAAAAKKLQMVSNLVGHEAKQERFPFVLTRDELSTNIQILARYQFEKAVAKIGQPVDRDEWFMTAAEVNAYYNPTGNQIVFPAGILQPPFFSSKHHPARNFGAIGSVIGHELTHGFDSQGRNYDGNGNLVSWWTNATAREFDQRAKCLVDQYSAFSVASAFDASRVLGNVNGNFTLSENIADNGGVKLSFSAFQKAMAEFGDGDAPAAAGAAVKDGGNHGAPRLSAANAEKLFFVSFAQAFCAKSTDEAMVRRLSTDPHSPEQWRINGVMMNSDEFARVFSCPRGSNMNPERKCRLW